MKKSTAKKRQEGQALIMAIIFLLALTFLGLGLIMVAAIDSQTARNLRLSEEAMTAAEEGMMLGLAYSADPTLKFSAQPQGTSITVNSADHGYTMGSQFLSFVSTISVGGEASGMMGEVPPGMESGTSRTQKFRIVRVRSVGTVNTGDGQIQRTIEVIANVREL